MTITSVLDRSLWLFRQRAPQYLLITLCTYGVGMLVTGYLYFSGILDPEKLDPWQGNFLLNPDLLLFLLFVTLPGILSDLALQQYTSKLVRNQEIPWYAALRKAFSVDLLNYICCRLMGSAIMLIVGGIGIFLLIIPVVGWAAYYLAIVGAYTIVNGLIPAILVEERKGMFGAMGRNMALSFRQFGVTTVGSGLGLVVSLAFMISGLILVLLTGLLVQSLLEGNSSLMIEPDASERFFMNLLVVCMPLLVAIFFTPLASVFYSVLYYGLRSKAEGFHLENRLEQYEEKVKKETSARARP